MAGPRVVVKMLSLLEAVEELQRIIYVNKF
jgi:hypothetical protein